MSILRGANRPATALENYSIKTDRRNFGDEKQQLMKQLKKLLKENTFLKQENLKLRQQLMLGKIQLENLKIKVEELSTKTPQIPPLNISAIKDRNLNANVLIKTEQLGIQPLYSQRTTSSFQFPLSKDYLETMSVYQLNPGDASDRLSSFRSQQLNNPRSNKENVKYTGNQQVSRKQQIMAKYRPAIQIDYVGDLSMIDQV